MVGINESSTDIPSSTVVFVHAHPDDEAIFTGGTLAGLARAGHRTVVLFATSGELGARAEDDRTTADVAARRRDEAVAACELLGVARVVFLDHVDSGLEASAYDRPWGAYVDVDLSTAADQIVAIVREERADAIVTYDDFGVYGHPDHVHVHEAAVLAADRCGVATRYLATVDREYLHFVESHLVDHAGAAVPSIRPIGSSTVEITTTVAIHDDLDAKRAAIAAHESQVGTDPWLGVPESFADVYGYEWYVRVGPAGVIDTLAARPEDSVPTDPPRLAPDELATVAAGLATAVRHGELPTADPGSRRWWRLLATDAYDAWLIAWPTGGAVTPHDHGGSAGAFAVVSGTLTEVVFAGGTELRHHVSAGGIRPVPASSVHDVVNEREGVAVSVHVYSPPLASMAFYDEHGRAPLRSEAVDIEAPVWSSPGAAAPSPRTDGAPATAPATTTTTQS